MYILEMESGEKLLCDWYGNEMKFEIRGTRHTVFVTCNFRAGCKNYLFLLVV